jgi:hypothetical protein
VKHSVIPQERIENRILLIRSQKVMLDSDLADLYGVSTKRLNEQVKRNRGRFPEDFMFQLTLEEGSILRSQFATSRLNWGGRRTRPFVFTEHGALMLASVLNSKRAMEVSIFVVRAFVRLRQLLATHADLARQLEALEKKYDYQLGAVFDAIRRLTAPPEPRKRRIGFEKDS